MHATLSVIVALGVRASEHFAGLLAVKKANDHLKSARCYAGSMGKRLSAKDCSSRVDFLQIIPGQCGGVANGSEMNRDFPLPDPAAVFGAAVSLWREVKKRATIDRTLNLSECYNGLDELMRQVMRIATEFEVWACRCVSFEEMDDVWPYLLEDRFGAACLSHSLPQALAEFGKTDYLRVAWKLHLPIRIEAGLPVPVDVLARNPASGAAFCEFRIQTVRDSNDDDLSVPFTADDEPYDEDLGEPHFSLYGVGADGLLEHIADRSSYVETVQLAAKLAPGIKFPMNPISRSSA